MARKSLVSAIRRMNEDRPLNRVFLQDVMMAIEDHKKKNSRTPSKTYKPSSMKCMRQMYFMRSGAPTDVTVDPYNSIGMADTGTRRHEAIQEVLLAMSGMGYDWEYVDVAEYVKRKQGEGKCLNLIVKDKRGAETHLTDSLLNTSFMCDGILLYKPTGEYVLFEFKNQISFKADGKQAVDEEHHNQVVAYCAELDLTKALVLYENRDNCSLYCPELFVVTDEMKSQFYDRIFECEGYVERMIAPPKVEDKKVCRWCKYKTECRRV